MPTSFPRKRKVDNVSSCAALKLWHLSFLDKRGVDVCKIIQKDHWHKMINFRSPAKNRVGSLMQLTNDASARQFLAQIPEAKVS